MALSQENEELRATISSFQGVSPHGILSVGSSHALLQNSNLFTKLRDLFRSKAFTVYAANELDKAYCVLEGCVHIPIDEHQKERIACSWAAIPAVDAVAHQIGFRHVLKKTERDKTTEAELERGESSSWFGRRDSLKMLDDLKCYLPPAVQDQGQDELVLLEEGYLEGLRNLTLTSNLTCEEIYLAVNCGHLAFRCGLPFRQMHSSDYGPLLSEARNKPVCHLTQLDREKSFTLICKAAQLILEYLKQLDTPKPSSTQPGMAVFLGGSCNPTTWRVDTAIPMLEAAGTSYYNPQVEDWSPELVEIEACAKAEASVLFFVIDKQTRALASMIEASEYISAGRKLVLVVQEVEAGAVIGSDTVDEAEAKDLNRARSYLRDVAERHGTKAYATIDEGINAVIDMTLCRDK